MQQQRGTARYLWMALFALGAWFALRPTAGGAARAFCDETQPPPAGTVVMLATAWCPYCAKARGFLNRHGVAWCELDTETSARGRALFRTLGGRGVPVIIVGERILHGYDEAELARLVAGGRGT